MFPLAKQKIIHVHASDLEIGKIYHPALSVHAEPNQFALALTKPIGKRCQVICAQGLYKEEIESIYRITASCCPR